MFNSNIMQLALLSSVRQGRAAMAIPLDNVVVEPDMKLGLQVVFGRLGHSRFFR